jgi:CBS-domain-containing membrane protein
MHSVQSLTADQSATKAIEILQTGQMLVPVLDNKQVLLGVLSWIDLWKLHPPKTSFLKRFFKNK